MKARIAALAAALATVFTSAAQAVIMQARWSGDYDGWVDTLGLFSPPGTLYFPQFIGTPVSYSVTLYYDTDLGATSASAFNSTLHWTQADGGNSPFLGGQVDLSAFHATVPEYSGSASFLIHDSSSFSITRDADGNVAQDIVGPWGLFSLAVLLQQPQPRAFGQTDPYPGFTGFGNNGVTIPYGGPNPHIHALTIAQVDALPAAIAALPEPATWLMMILGLGSIGAIVRNRRARPIA